MSLPFSQFPEDEDAEVVGHTAAVNSAYAAAHGYSFLMDKVDKTKTAKVRDSTHSCTQSPYPLPLPTPQPPIRRYTVL